MPWWQALPTQPKHQPTMRNPDRSLWRADPQLQSPVATSSPQSLCLLAPLVFCRLLSSASHIGCLLCHRLPHRQAPFSCHIPLFGLHSIPSLFGIVPSLFHKIVPCFRWQGGYTPTDLETTLFTLFLFRCHWPVVLNAIVIWPRNKNNLVVHPSGFELWRTIHLLTALYSVHCTNMHCTNLWWAQHNRQWEGHRGHQHWASEKPNYLYGQQLFSIILNGQQLYIILSYMDYLRRSNISSTN